MDPMNKLQSMCIKGQRYEKSKRQEKEKADMEQERIRCATKEYEESKKLVAQLHVDTPITLSTYLHFHDLQMRDVQIKHCGLILMIDPEILFNSNTLQINWKPVLIKLFQKVSCIARKGKRSGTITGSNDGFIFIKCQNVESPTSDANLDQTTSKWISNNEIAQWVKECQVDHLCYDKFIRYMVSICGKNLTSFVYVSNVDIKPSLIIRGYVYTDVPNIWDNIKGPHGSKLMSTFSDIRAKHKQEYEYCTHKLYNAISLYENIFSKGMPLYKVTDKQMKFVYE